MTLSPTPITLALDTATPFLTLALVWPGGVRVWSAEVGRAHAERVAGAVAELFAEAELPLRAGRIVIGTGPGSYTGVRVGASYALGLARVWGAEVVGVPTLEGLVRGPDGVKLSGEVAVSLDARRGNVYGAVYRVEAGVVAEVIHAPEKQSMEEFQSRAAGLPHFHDGPPSGEALLRAGLAHGHTDWALSYL
ncbi:tRNA (adenosine(37)-N6)-threonylcarbamoyltransferase complex dimerization subunit type 1 TsaB [Deinococcus sp. Arct2-2]|uniref:tRNA (adenosine(37)-N6)-threonylcarbamoyltransferase complex dimerization subunit type 1 TsaB n=1 Tax=Deinococcus sp. Arct2-2 TaxID=2568653 RepID=UPI001F0E3F7D|nr:tRNA (adenosine(37)-N6)-threonylcarbamoyltransferase complex dimerization subunit type 1 TsaB [Deinococcus sp. Arct2-2]